MKTIISDVFKGTVLVDPGKLTLKTVNLSFQAIQVSWKLEETEIEDKYEIVTDVKFETNVPAPVVVMNMPNSIPAEDLQLGESLMFNVTLVNKGLITAEDVQLQMPSGFKTFTFEPMIQGHLSYCLKWQLQYPKSDENSIFIKKSG